LGRASDPGGVAIVVQQTPDENQQTHASATRQEQKPR